MTIVERDLEVGHVVARRDDDGARVAHRRLLEHRVVAHVGDEDGHAEGPRGREEPRGRVALDRDDLDAAAAELLEHAEAEVPEPAEDDVVAVGGGHDAVPFSLAATAGGHEEGEADDALAEDDEPGERVDGVEHVEVPRVGRAEGDLGEQRIAARLPGIGIESEQRAVVVEHFLEMRDLPALVHAVTAEAATELIMDAAFGHADQGRQGGVAGNVIFPAVAAIGPSQQERQIAGMRELGRTAEAAMTGIETAQHEIAPQPDRKSVV